MSLLINTPEEVSSALDSLNEIAQEIHINGISDDMCLLYEQKVKPRLDPIIEYFNNDGKAIVLFIPFVGKLLSVVILLKTLVEQSCSTIRT